MWSWWSALFIHAFIINRIQIQRKIWIKQSPGHYILAHCSTPTNNDIHHTQKYSYDACKCVFRVRRMLSFIHSCIHHHLDWNTEKDMDIIVCRLLHDDALLLVAYYQLTIMCSIPTVFIQPMQTCIQHEAVGLLYSFVHSSSFVFKYLQGYGPNSLQATTCAHCSTPTNSDRHTQQYS